MITVYTPPNIYILQKRSCACSTGLREHGQVPSVSCVDLIRHDLTKVWNQPGHMSYIKIPNDFKQLENIVALFDQLDDLLQDIKNPPKHKFMLSPEFIADRYERDTYEFNIDKVCPLNRRVFKVVIKSSIDLYEITPYSTPADRVSIPLPVSKESNTEFYQVRQALKDMLATL